MQPFNKEIFKQPLYNVFTLIPYFTSYIIQYSAFLTLNPANIL